MNDFATWLASTRLSAALAQNAVAFPLLEIAHVIAISLVLGTVFIFDLRLIGWGWRRFPAERLLATVRPVTIAGFALALATGFLLFASQPVSYLDNYPFQLKLALLAAAGANVLLFHAGLPRFVGRWDAGGAVPLPVRISALLSLLLWVSILVAGRFVGFFLHG